LATFSTTSVNTRSPNDPREEPFPGWGNDCARTLGAPRTGGSSRETDFEEGDVCWETDGEERGKLTGSRVLPHEGSGPKVEVTFQASDKILGIDAEVRK
jgi:hypothetical protein